MQEAKADAGKLEISLTPVQIVRDIAEVRMYGTKKYGDPDNWKRVELQRYINAMLRHTLAFWEDPHSVDEESGIPHYKHAECNWAFISEMMKEKVEADPQTCKHEWECTGAFNGGFRYTCTKCLGTKSEMVKEIKNDS